MDLLNLWALLDLLARLVLSYMVFIVSGLGLFVLLAMSALLVILQIVFKVFYPDVGCQVCVPA